MRNWLIRELATSHLVVAAKPLFFFASLRPAPIRMTSPDLPTTPGTSKVAYLASFEVVGALARLLRTVLE